MKKLLSILLSSVMLFGAITSAGAFSAVAVEETTVEESTVEESVVEDNTVDDNDTDDSAVGDSDVVYSVIGNSEQLFYFTDNIYDKTTEMTYDPNVGLYKFMFYEVDPENDICIKIVKNHSINANFDIQSTFFIFDVVSACDILVTFDNKTGVTNVLGEGVVPFNVRNVVLVGSGNSAFSWDYNSEDNRMTEVEQGVWEIEYNDVMMSSRPYCQAYFAVNPVGLSQKYSMSYGFGNAESEIVESGVETEAYILNSRNIAFTIEKNYSTVKFRLDLRNFDCLTKKGAKFTVTVTPPEKEPTFGVLYVDENDKPYAPDSEIPMVYNVKTGLYELSVTNDFPSTDCRFYVLKNHGEDGKYGDPETGGSYYYDVNKGKDIDIIFDTLTDEISIVGYGVLNKANFKVNRVIAAGNGSGSYLNGFDWEPTNRQNEMKETSPGVWEITFNEVSANDNYQVKFAINNDVHSTNPWQFYFGSVNGDYYNTNEEQAVVRNGGAICFKVAKNRSKVTLKLDLRDFSFRNRNDLGAKLTIKVESPDYFVRFKDEMYKTPMTLNEETGLYECEINYDSPSLDQQFHISKNDEQNKMYYDPECYFDVYGIGTVTITFDPKKEKINVLGDIFQFEKDFEINTIIAMGNGNGAYLNDAYHKTNSKSNMLTETSDGIWEITYYNVEAYKRRYYVTFMVNSLKTNYNYTWFPSFGTRQTESIESGVEYDAVYCGAQMFFDVEEDDSTVNFKLDLRNFNYRTKQGAKVTITVTPPDPQNEEPSPTLAGDVNGDNVVDILDAVMVQKFSADKTEFNQAQLAVADFNGDGNIDILDAAAIQKHAAAA